MDKSATKPRNLYKARLIEDGEVVEIYVTADSFSTVEKWQPDTIISVELIQHGLMNLSNDKED